MCVWEGGRTQPLLPFSVVGLDFTSLMNILGDLVRHDGSCLARVNNGFRKMWSRYFTGAGSRQGKQLPPSIRIQDINRTCWPGFAFRCSWRQMNTELVSRTDKQQRRLYGCALAHRMRADETMEQFMNRRKHAALTEVRRHGKWSWKAAVRIVLWDLHLPRNHSGAWVCGLRNWKGDIWLRTRRMLMNPVSISVALRELAVLQGIPGPGGTKAFNSLWSSRTGVSCAHAGYT